MSDTYAHMQREPRRARSKRRVYRKWFQCEAKRCFSDEIAARVAGQLSIEERGEVTQLWVYACPRCKRWHLTSQPHGDRWAVLFPEKRKAA